MNKIMFFQQYSHNLLVDMWSYLRRSKQTNLIYIQFPSNYLFQKLVQKVVKKTLEYESILYKPTELLVDLYYFQKILSPRYNIILNLLSVSYVSSKIGNVLKNLFLKSIPEVDDSLCYFLYYRS